MNQKTPFAGLNKIGTYLDEDLPKINENTDITDAQFKQAAQERQAEAQIREAADASLASGLQEVHASISAEIKSRTEAVEEESQARASMMREHDKSATAHDVLVRRITAGSISPVIGICHLEYGNYTGLWAHCDENGQPVSPNPLYFDFHPVYQGMRPVLIDGQVMIEIPAFWIKHLVPTNGPFAGKRCKIISPEPREGFRLYPAFYAPSGDALKHIYIAKYQGTDEGGNPKKVGSRPGKFPLVNKSIGQMSDYCANRNSGGVNGFHLWDFYEYSALCLLFLIEHATTESQGIMGCGHNTSNVAVRVDDEKQSQWHGFVGLFANVWQMVDGFRLTPDRHIELFKNDGSRQWVNTGSLAPSRPNPDEIRYVLALHSGYGSGFCLDDCFIYSDQTTNPAQATFPDGFWGGCGDAGNILLIGNCWWGYNDAGLFCQDWGWTSNTLGVHVGCRCAKW